MRDICPGHPAFNLARRFDLAARTISGGNGRLHIFVDHSSLELFGNDGLVYFTERVFPGEKSLGIEFFVDGGQVELSALDIYSLDSMKMTQVGATGENEDG